MNINLCYFDLEKKFLTEYLEFSLGNTNRLSSCVLDLIKQDLGRFFTFLPESTNANKLYSLREGGIALGVKPEITRYILNKVDSEYLYGIYDDTSSRYVEDYCEPLYLRFGLHSNDEVYYCICPEEASLEIISQCMQASNSIWHSLAVLSKTSGCPEESKRINIDMMKSICEKATLVIIGAYDGEGYIFWQRDATTDTKSS